MASCSKDSNDCRVPQNPHVTVYHDPDDPEACLWGCDEGWATCGGSPCSIDLLHDPRNCGQCGNSCAIDACWGYAPWGGVCPPKTIAAGLGVVNGWFAVPYTVLVYPIIYVLMPKFWSVSKQHGYVTAADFVKDRFGSNTLAFAMALTGIIATLPYIALQMFGIQVSLAALGIPLTLSIGSLQIDLPLLIAFLILAAYTYTSGLRAPAMIALVKDVMIFITLIAILIVIPAKLGGFGAIFSHVAQKAAPATIVQNGKAVPNPFSEFLRNSNQNWAYVTLALGSALALFLYPHSLTGVLSSNSRNVVKRNAALLPIYSLMLGLLALTGYMAIAANVKPLAPFGVNGAVPALINQQFPSWFAGFAFAAIAIGALVPAAVMSIAAANLFTRNIYKEYLRRDASDREESTVAKWASFVLKFGAVLFIVYIPTAQVINFQLLGGIWILQTLPAVFLGLYTHWFNRWALLIGWLVSEVLGTIFFVIITFRFHFFNMIREISKIHFINE